MNSNQIQVVHKEIMHVTPVTAESKRYIENWKRSEESKGRKCKVKESTVGIAIETTHYYYIEKDDADAMVLGFDANGSPIYRQGECKR